MHKLKKENKKTSIIHNRVFFIFKHPAVRLAERSKASVLRTDDNEKSLASSNLAPGNILFLATSPKCNLLHLSACVTYRIVPCLAGRHNRTRASCSITSPKNRLEPLSYKLKKRKTTNVSHVLYNSLLKLL